ncbi:hypothetical protein NX059_003523 [Plenodomus lindquistii]|nr:hypothetical protein NX059_003523 [Plenodomus lindquistii]
MTINDVIQQIELVQGERGIPFPLRRDYISKWYPNSNRTTGMKLDAFGAAIRAAGFTPSTHRILSWYSNVDIEVFSRALRKDNSLLNQIPRKHLTRLIDDSGENCLQSVNLGILVKWSSNLTSGRLGFVFRSLFPDHRLDMHQPENDTLATCMVYQELIKGAKKFGGAQGQKIAGNKGMSEKITDGMRSMYEKATGKKVNPKFSN